VLTNETNMVIMAQELCRAMGIDIPALIQTIEDQGFNTASALPLNDRYSEMDIDDGHQ
jgi:hypothetical protein